MYVRTHYEGDSCESHDELFIQCWRAKQIQFNYDSRDAMENKLDEIGPHVMCSDCGHCEHDHRNGRLDIGAPLEWLCDRYQCDCSGWPR